MKDFLNELKDKTRNIHGAAEATGFIKRLQSGQANRVNYAEYIYNLLPVYEAIEKSLEELRSNDRIAPFATKELYKSELMKKDIEFLLGDKVKELDILESTKAYVKRIEEAKESNPIAVIAHAYTRFLADLFGGRSIAELMEKGYNIEAEGLNYYDLNGIKAIMPYVKEYREKLMNLNLSDEEVNQFINEVSNSYVYNIGISTELDIKLYIQDYESSMHHK